MRDIPLIYCRFDWAKNYYYGYKENLIFDSFILSLSRSTGDWQEVERYKEQLKEFIPFVKKPFNYLEAYVETILREEFQGTIYSIVKDIYELEWAPVDPLSEEINSDYEKDCVDKVIGGGGSFMYSDWCMSMYIGIASESPVPISHLRLRKKIDLFTLVGNHHWNKQSGARAIREVYDFIAEYCRPRGRRPKKFDIITKRQGLDTTFAKIWDHNIKHCNFTESLNAIAMELEHGQPDYMTKVLLFGILWDIVRKHYSAEAAAEMDLTAWSNSLKNQLSTIVGELHENNGETSGCIIA